jgi:hypothetical protein
MTPTLVSIRQGLHNRRYRCSGDQADADHCLIDQSLVVTLPIGRMIPAVTA